MADSYTFDELVSDESPPHSGQVYSFDDLTKDQGAATPNDFQSFSELGPTQENTDYLKESLLKNAEIPAGTGPVTVPLAALGRSALGLAKYATTPQGVEELGLSATPAAPLVALKWTKDMAEGVKEGVQNIHDSLSSLIGNRIGEAMMRNQNIPIPDSIKQAQQETVQQLADAAANTVLSGLGALGTAHAAIKGTAGLLPRASEAAMDSVKGDVKDAVQEIINQPKEENASGQQEAATVYGNLRPQSVEGAGQVPEPEGGGGVQPQAERGIPATGPAADEVQAGQAGVLPVTVQSVWDAFQRDRYEQRGEVQTMGDVANALEQVSNLPTDVQEALQNYRDAEKSDLEEFGQRSGETELYGDALEKAVEKHVKTAEEPSAPTVVSTTSPEFETALSALEKDPSNASLVGKAAMAAKTSQDLAKVQEVAKRLQSKGIAASVRNKWTTATEGPFGSEAGFVDLGPLTDLWDKYSPKVREAVDNLKGIVKEQMSLPAVDDYRRSVLNWSAKMQRSFGEAASAREEIQNAVRDPIRRDGITNWIQAGGDPTVLQDRLAKTVAWRDPVTGKPHPQATRLAAGYEASLNLTPEEIAVANDARRAFDTLHSRGTGYGVLNSFKDNYVTQIWDLNKGPTGGGGGRTLRDKFRFSRASSFPTYFDGEQAGFVPKTKDISKILPVYLHEMNSVIANRQLVEQMSRGKASDGRPLLAAKGTGVAVTGPKGAATLVLPDAMKSDFSDYKTLPNQPALHDWRWQTKDAAGNPVFMKADLAIHPEAVDKFKNVLGKSAISEWYRSSGSRAASIPKSILRGVDVAQSETKRTMLGAGAPFHQVQEGTHAVGHRVSPFTGIPEIDLANNRAQMDAANHGLMLLPDRASAEQFMEGFRQSGLVSKIPGVGPLADHYSNYLFHEYIPGLKFKTYEAILDRNMKVYADDIASGKASVEEVKALAASQTNAAYGHLNYADLARNPTIQHLMRLGLLAPDFLEARMRFAGQAIKGIGGAKIGREQVIALATLAVAQASLSYLAAKATGGQWDPKDPFTFHLGNRKFTLRSVPEDLMRLAMDSRAFISARLSPLMRTADQLRSGTDWRGNKVTAGQTLKEMAQQPIPLVLRPLLGTANSPLSGWEQLAGAVGLKISRYSAQSEIRKIAHNWAANSKDPKVRAEEARYQKESFGDSDYKPLREALINNDFKTAKEEYQKLLQTKDPSIVARTMTHPKPFSGKVSREPAFQQSLSADQKVLYDQAKKEQDEMRQKFNKLIYGR